MNERTFMVSVINNSINNFSVQENLQDYHQVRMKYKLKVTVLGQPWRLVTPGQMQRSQVASILFIYLLFFCCCWERKMGGRSEGGNQEAKPIKDYCCSSDALDCLFIRKGIVLLLENLYNNHQCGFEYSLRHLWYSGCCNISFILLLKLA